MMSREDAARELVDATVSHGGSAMQRVFGEVLEQYAVGVLAQHVEAERMAVLVDKEIEEEAKATFGDVKVEVQEKAGEKARDALDRSDFAPLTHAPPGARKAGVADAGEVVSEIEALVGVGEVVSEIEALVGVTLPAVTRLAVGGAVIRYAMQSPTVPRGYAEEPPQPEVPDFPPFVPGQQHVPEWYRLRNIPTRGGQRVSLDTFAFIGAIHDSRPPFSEAGHPEVAAALKYLLRAGRKPGSPVMQDIAKAQECLQRLSTEVEEGRRRGSAGS